MMNNARVKRFLRLFGEGFVAVVRRHPIELLLVAACTLWLIVGLERSWLWHETRTAWMLLLLALWAFAVNSAVGGKAGRILYWISWTPLIPLYCWSGLSDWMETQTFLLTSFILLPLALLLCRRAVRNDRFVADASVYVRSAVLAVLFANVALGLFEAILWSTAYIFGFLQASWVDDVGLDAVILAEVFLQPLLFLMMCDRWMGAPGRRSRVLEVLINYIFTPALMIYAAILALFIVRICFLWSLPEGFVAKIVLAFAVLMLVVRALREKLEKRFGDWFYRAYSLVTLPAAVLFWAGVARRVGDYGLTVPRVWLIVCGSLMTLSILLLISRRTGRYYYLTLAAFVCVAALAYVPSLQPGRIAVREQLRRVESTARSLGMLAPDGQHLFIEFAADEQLVDAYRRLYTSLNYVANHDPEVFERFGFSMDELREAVPAALYNRVVYGSDSDSYTPYEQDYFSLSATPGRVVGGVDRYRKIYTRLLSWEREKSAWYDYSGDTLRIYLNDAQPALEITGSELLQRQLAKSDLEQDELSEDAPASLVDQLLVYSDERMMILFSDMYFQRTDSVSLLSNVTIDAVLVR